jgi:hypothetical protein
MAYQKPDDKGRARQHRERALEIDPKFAQAEETRKALGEMAKG